MASERRRSLDYPVFILWRRREKGSISGTPTFPLTFPQSHHHRFKTFLGHLRVSTSDPRQRMFPFLGQDFYPYSTIANVSFSHRATHTSGGAFYDYTTRYGAIRDNDMLTLRESMFPESIPEAKPNPLATSALEKPKVHKHTFSQVVRLSEEEEMLFNTLVKEMHLDQLLDLPLIALSNGQMRRARIVKAVLKKPELLLLDEPLSTFFFNKKHSHPTRLHMKNR